MLVKVPGHRLEHALPTIISADQTRSFALWIKLLYQYPSASVRTNSELSKPFGLHRGSRQGCPLSPMLFYLAIEPLATALHDSKDISGIWRSKMEHKVSLYADELLLFVSNPSTSLQSVWSPVRIQMKPLQK